MPLPFVFHASCGHLRNDVKKSTPAAPSAFCRQHHLGSGLAPAPAASVGVVAAVPAPVVMARDDPEEKLAKLKSMLDKGLITQAEYDFKKAEVLAGM